MQNGKLDTLNKAFRVLIALAVIVGAVYWAYTSTRNRTYAGSELSFELAGGTTVIENPSEEPVTAHLSSKGSSASFTVISDAQEDRITSTREGSGASAVHRAELELPPGLTELQVTRGSNVMLTTEGETRINATVSPTSANGARTIWIVALVVVVGALYYISRTLQHRWLAALRQRLQQPGSERPTQAST